MSSWRRFRSLIPAIHIFGGSRCEVLDATICQCSGRRSRTQVPGMMMKSRISSAQLSSLVRTVVQCFQEFNDIGFVLCGHRRRFVGMPVEGRVGYVDIEVVLCRDVWLMGL